MDTTLDMNMKIVMDMEGDMEIWMRTWKQGQGQGKMDEDMETWTRTWKHERGHRNGHQNTDKDKKIKRKTEAQMIFICLPFAHHANRSLSFVRLLMKNKRKLSICKPTKCPTGTCLLWVLYNRVRSLRQFWKDPFWPASSCNHQFPSQEVPEPPDTFTYPHCQPLHVIALCILIAFRRKFVKILGNDVSINF